MNTEFDPAFSRAIAWEAMQAKMERERLESQARPFRFEDLNGRPEPASWGPVYPKTASAAVEKWRMVARGRALTADEKREHGRAVGEWIRALNNPGAKRHAIPDSDLHYRFSLAKWNGAIRVRFAALAAADRRAWCDGKAKSKSVGDHGLTIRQVYARAMAEKRARELEAA